MTNQSNEIFKNIKLKPGWRKTSSRQAASNLTWRNHTRNHPKTLYGLARLASVHERLIVLCVAGILLLNMAPSGPRLLIRLRYMYIHCILVAVWAAGRLWAISVPSHQSICCKLGLFLLFSFGFVCGQREIKRSHVNRGINPPYNLLKQWVRWPLCRK